MGKDMLREEEGPVALRQQALRKCLVTNDPVVTKTKLWVPDTDQNETHAG